MGTQSATKDLNHFLGIEKDCDAAYRDNNDTCQRLRSYTLENLELFTLKSM